MGRERTGAAVFIQVNDKRAERLRLVRGQFGAEGSLVDWPHHSSSHASCVNSEHNLGSTKHFNAAAL